jgi:hypothetical protein
VQFEAKSLFHFLPGATLSAPGLVLTLYLLLHLLLLLIFILRTNVRFFKEASHAETDLSLPSPLRLVAAGLRTIQFLFLPQLARP